jgi:hypothetical protein
MVLVSTQHLGIICENKKPVAGEYFSLTLFDVSKCPSLESLCLWYPVGVEGFLFIKTN